MGVFARMNPGKAMIPGTGEAAMMISKRLVEVMMLEKMPLPEFGGGMDVRRITLKGIGSGDKYEVCAFSGLVHNEKRYAFICGKR